MTRLTGREGGTEPAQTESAVRELRLDQISDLPETKDLRAGGINQDHVDAMVQALDRDPDSLEPIEVVALPGDLYGTIDGYHRRQAHGQAERATIRAIMLNIEPGDWLTFAMRANLTHGLRFTTDDRKAAARRLIEADPGRSDRTIGADCGLHGETVGKVRRTMTEAAPSREKKSRSEGKPATAGRRQLPGRVGRDNKRRPAQRGAARASAKEVAKANPDATLEEIAKQAGTSVRTAGEGRRLARVGQTADNGTTESTGPAKPASEPPDDKAPMRMTDLAFKKFVQPFNDLAQSLNREGIPKQMAVARPYWDEFAASVRFLSEDYFQRFVKEGK